MMSATLGALFAGRADVIRRLIEGDTTTIIIAVIVFGIMITIGIVRAVKSSGSGDDDERPLKKKKKRPRDDDDDDDDRPRKRKPHEW